MNREELFRIMGDIHDRYIEEALHDPPGDEAGSPERIVKMKRKRVITFALAAALILSLSISAYAGLQRVASPQAAERVATEQIEVWKEMGLLSPEVSFEGEPKRIDEGYNRIGD